MRLLLTFTNTYEIWSLTIYLKGNRQQHFYSTRLRLQNIYVRVFLFTLDIMSKLAFWESEVGYIRSSETTKQMFNLGCIEEKISIENRHFNIISDKQLYLE